MIIPTDVENKLGELQPYIREAGKRVRELVLGFCADNGYAYVERYKDKRSVAEKIESGRYGSWDDIDDLFACSIVIPTLAEEPAVLLFLEEFITPISVKKRGASSKDPQVFRFDSTRFIGKLKNLPLDANIQLAAMKFEVQIRSAFEHAWATTTHSLAYKGDIIDWRRMRLAAQLKASVEQLDLLILGFSQAANNVVEQQWREVVLLKKVAEFFVTAKIRDVIPSEGLPETWTKFSENILQLIKQTVGYDKYNAEACVDNALNIVGNTIAELNSESFPRSISLFQLTLGILTENDLLAGQFKRYHPLITSQLIDLFPKTAVLGSAFNL